MKKLLSPIQFISLLAILAAGLFLAGCNKNSTEPDPGSDELQLSTEAQSASQTGWQIMNSLNTNDQLSEMVSGGISFIEDQPGMVNSPQDIRQAEKTMKRIYTYARKSGSLSKISSDSLIWFEEWSTANSAGRRALYYNDSTMIARFYEVIDRFPGFLRLEYDSTEIRVFAGPVLEDSTDHRLLNIDKLTLFESGFFVERVESSVEATHWDQTNEVIGAIAANRVWYGEQLQLEQLSQDAQIIPDSTGSFVEQFDYRDGTSLHREIHFDFANYNGDFSETWRNGTTVSGTFDLLEDDNHAAVSRVIDFNSHLLLDRIEQSADYTLDPGDSSSTAILTTKLFFHNGDLDTARVEVERFREGDRWKEHFVTASSRGGESDFTVTYFDEYKEFEGHHITSEGFFILFNGTEYAAGNGEIYLEVYATQQAYQQGDPPLLTAHIIYGSDGSGSGEITEGGQTYRVKFDASGEIEVTDSSGKSATLSAY